MTVVYIDEVFLLNALVDYLLLLAAARLSGEVLHRGRVAAGALLGGAYAALTLLPGWAFLGRAPCRLALAAALTLAAFGGSRRLLRVGLVFLGVSCAFGGGVLALQMFLDAPAALDLRTVLLAAAVCYVFLSLVFSRSLRHGAGELAPVRVELGGRVCRLAALRDTGNTLTDPLTGKPVLVCEGEKLSGLFLSGEAPTAAQLRDPAGALEALRGPKWRLLPYRAVGVERGLLLCVRADRVEVGKDDYGPILVALSPTPVSDGGGYQALIGE